MSDKEKKKHWSTPQLILAAVILLLAIAVLTMTILWQINEFSLKLTLNGPKELTIEYGDTYEEQGAAAVFRGTVFMQDPAAIDVAIEGGVDTAKVGTYYINYKAVRDIDSLLGDRILTDYARRIVHVVDTAPPEITLTSDPNVFTIPGESYHEEGFAAYDDYDGDITERVVRSERDGIVFYEVTDSSGNIARAERPIVYHDPIAPELTLTGESALSLELGSTYTEPGYTATDNCDGDITDRVTVSGSVDTSAAGTYTLVYTVKDSYDNTATASRTVTVREPEPETTPQETTDSADATEPPTEEPVEVRVDPPNPVGGVIYLTFDDGPSRHTARLLDILAKYNAKASFFVVNTAYISTVSRIASEGHTVAIHSATHDFQEIYASEEAYFSDLEKMQSIVESHTGSKPMFLRFPGGSSNTVSRFNPGIMTRLTELVEEEGYTYFDWNVDSQDAGGARTSLRVYNNVVSAVATRRSSVVLLHDIKSYTVDTIEDILIWGLANGYTFEALTESSPTCHHSINN